MSSKTHQEDADSGPEMLDAEDAQEILDAQEDDGDIAMDSGDDEDREEIMLQNDSIAYFDQHRDSVFAIAQHPLHPHLVATGGSEGEEDDASGKGYVIDTSVAESRPTPVLPPSFAIDAAAAKKPLTELEPIFAIEGHTDSVNSLVFTLPRGEYLVSAGLDGRLRAYSVKVDAKGKDVKLAFVGEAQETEEINWVAACPSPEYANAVALGASDGSVWVYSIDASNQINPLQIVQAYFLHTQSCTGGTWTADGLLIATVSEDSSLHIFDVWGVASNKGLVSENGQTVASFNGTDQRFFVEGGLFSVATAPTNSFLAVGGAGGAVRIVGLPRLSDAAPASGSAPDKSKQVRRGVLAEPSAQTCTVLACLNVQSDSIESLAFAPAPQTLLAAASVDGSIAVFDTAKSFSVRRHIQAAHEGEPVVQVEFVRSGAAGWQLTSAGTDGVVRRWDLRGATASQHVTHAAASGLVKEWRGHGGGGERCGVLGFVQGESGERVVTAGDDGVVSVFEV